MVRLQVNQKNPVKNHSRKYNIFLIVWVRTKQFEIADLSGIADSQAGLFRTTKEAGDEKSEKKALQGLDEFRSAIA